MELLEIEVKSYCDDHAPVLKKLHAIEAQHGGRFKEVDLYMNHPARDFRKTDEALRIRQVGGRVLLTYKGPKTGKVSKTRVEEEAAVGDFDTILAIFTSLGFTPVGSVVKERDLYVMGEIEICIDRVEGLGNFVELEMKGTDVQGAERQLFALARELGLNRFENKSYLELKYGNNQS
ncbi:MAG: class IV adenylate cyclase [Spirochaetes bacterium]|nr:class IV adenylate cyclase [Spirochaetota bacterium]